MSRRPQGGSAVRPLSRRLAFRPQLLPLEERAVPDATPTTPPVSPTPPVGDKQIYAVGADAGNQPLVQVYNPDGSLLYSFTAFDSRYRGGVRVAVGDVTGDGVPDIVVAPGPGLPPQVKVYDGTSGADVANFMAYNEAFTGGVYVAVGDVNGDGRDDIITGAGQGGGPHVRVFDGKWVVPSLSATTGTTTTTTTTTTPGTTASPPTLGPGILTEFFAYDAAFRGGVRVAAGDFTGAGHVEIATAAGPSGGPHVKVIDPQSGELLTSFMAFDYHYTGGVYVTAGDIGGNGKAELAVGSGVGLRQAKVYGTDFSPLRSYTIDDPNAAVGVRVGMVDINGDGKQELLLGMGTEVQVRDPLNNATERTITPFDPTVLGSVNVG